MKRQITATLVTGLLAGGAFALAPSAEATDITNPSNNPAAYITFTSGGQEYTDGYDTLPGYDDYACTAIPGVTYDFADDQVNYPNGESRHWTDWSRISSYATWKKQQEAAASASAKPTKAASSSSGTKSSSSSTTKTTTKGTKSTTKSSSSTTKSHASATASASTDPSATASASADPSATASASADASASASASATVSTSPTAVSTLAGDTLPVAAAVSVPEELNASVTSSVGQGSDDTSIAGLGILGALVIAGGALVGGDAVRRGLQAGRRH